jgi:predicted enzyme related to lactoylglutathione lyase
MPETKVLAPGFFCWCELGARDSAGAKRFYAGLFGWETHETPAGDAGTYGMIQLHGRAVGGLYQLTPDMAGVPPSWLPYVKVRSADASSRKAAELGGQIVMGPIDVMTAGRMSVLQDPTGGTFAIWEAREHGGAEAMGEVNSPCWFELVSTDKPEAGAFYAALFDWKLESFLGAMDYTMFKVGEQSVGGLMQRPMEMGDMPSHWMIYFSVADCDASVARVKQLGGSLCAGPMDIPSVGRFAVVADPDGAAFAVIRLSPPGDV